MCCNQYPEDQALYSIFAVLCWWGAIVFTNRNFHVVEITFYCVCYLDATLNRTFPSKITLSKDFILTLKVVVQADA